MKDTDPIRTCTGCRRPKPQGQLIRVALGRDGEIVVDPPGTRARTQGRGAYVCAHPACASRAVRSGGIARALRVDGALPRDLEQRLLGGIDGSGAV